MGTTRYRFESGEIQSVDAKLLYVTHSKYEHDWSSLPHTHRFAELCYICKGKGTYLIENKHYPVEQGDFVIVNSNVSHTETSAGDLPLEYIILGVEGLDFSFQGNQEHIIFKRIHEHEYLVFIMNTMFSEMEGKNPGYELVCKNLLEVLIVILLRQTSLTFEYAASADSGWECQKLKRYMEANYSQHITLDTLAEISHLNKYYLVHMFTKCFGCSPMSYLCDIRIRASKELIATTDYSITDIAHSTGFSSQSYFAQCFQKHCGMTAGEYRKKARS